MLAGSIKTWVEYFVILPLRWYRLHCRTWLEQRQRCKVCGCRDKFDFNVPDDIWQQIVPPQYQNRVVCLTCFDDFAKRKGVDYSTALKTIYFAGDKNSFKFSAEH